MFLNVLRDFSRPHWVDIVYEIKGSEGLSVGELGEKLGMSYMGVKQHCVEMEKKGYLDTWRRPRKVGRPEKTYRITNKVAPLFPGVGEEFSLSLLRGVKTSQGETAVDRLLYQHFQHESEKYCAKVKGETVEARGEAFAKLRSLEGRRSEWLGEEQMLIEYHDPMALIAAEFQSVNPLEEGLVGSVIGASVERTETRVAGLLKIQFKVV